jgi:hypothetical protein
MSRFPPGHPEARPELDVLKTGSVTCHRAAPGNPWSCGYLVQIRNIGAAPFEGPITFTDTIIAHPATLSGFIPSPPWVCVPGVGAAGPYTCTYPPAPGGLPPGDAVGLLIGFELPAATPVPSWEQNCAKTSTDVDGDGVPEERQSCTLSLICDVASANCPRDLAITKLVAAAPCLRGDVCWFIVNVQNVSDLAAPGPTEITDIPDPGLGAPVTAIPGQACVPAGGNFTCSDPAGIPPGGVLGFSIGFPVPADFPVTAFENCGELTAGVANVFPFNDKSCAVADIPGADLAPFGGTTCRRGESCTLDVRVDNKGKLLFLGSAGLRGTLSPAVMIASITSETPGFACSVTGSGSYECQGARLTIKPGGAAQVRLVIDVPADFPHDKIAHIKEMVWPDREVKDKNPANDRHESVITIEGPKEPRKEPEEPEEVPEEPIEPEEPEGPEITPTPHCARGWGEVDRSKAKALREKGWEIEEVRKGGRSILCAKAPPPPQCIGGRVVRGDCECPKGTERKETGRNAFTCVKTAPPPQCDKDWLEVDRDKAKALRAQGWEIREVTSGGKSILCAKPPSLTCSGGRVQDGQCVCPRGTERKETGPNTFTCVKTAPAPQCDKGWSQVDRDRAKALRAQGWEIREVTSGGQSILCAKPPSLTCSGGRVQDGQCICPKGTERKQTGTNAFACLKTTTPLPQLVCSGGSVEGGQCICPKGTERKQAGPNAFRCVKSAPALQLLICSGGSVEGGQCVCPKGTARQAAGPNAFRCRKLPTVR